MTPEAFSGLPLLPFRLYTVALKCVVCSQVYGQTTSTYNAHSSGVCSKSECKSAHRKAMDQARERARREK